MSRKAWFGYTATSIEDKPAPCVWYDELPNEKNYLNPTIVGKPVDVSSHIHDETKEVDLSFNQLKEWYPPPEYAAPKKLLLDQFNEVKEVIKPLVIDILKSENQLTSELAQ